MLWTLLYVIPSIVATIYFLYWCWKQYMYRNDGYWPSKGVKFIKAQDLTTVYERITLKKSLVDLDSEIYKQIGDEPYGGYTEFAKPVLFIKDLDLVKKFLVKDFDHFINRRGINLSKTDPYINKMLNNLINEEWKNIRSTLSPTFTTGKIKGMFELFEACGDQLITYLKTQAGTNSPDGIDIGKTMGLYTTDVIASTAFGIQTNSFTDPDAIFRKMAKQFQTITAFRLCKVILYLMVPKLFNIFKWPLVDTESTNFFVELITKAIKHRENLKIDNGSKKRNDFLQLLLDAKTGQLKEEDPNQLDTFEKEALVKGGKKANLDEYVIVSQSILFFIAGFDTTESLLMFMTYELALNPDVQELLAEEIIRVKEEHNGKFSYEAINKMEYLDMTMSETLRKYPPGIRLERKCNTEYQIPDTNIMVTKDMIVALSIYSIHHDEKYYPNPDKFDPQRFSPEEKAKRHPYAYLPFGHGPRNCIGMRFALIEAKMAIAKFVENFIIEPCAKTTIPLEFNKKTEILKPEKDIIVRIRPRN